MSNFPSQTFEPAADAAPYVAIPNSLHRVKLSFRVDFTNGGHLQAEDFLLDIPSPVITPQRAAEMVVSALNLLRAGVVTISSLKVVRRGEHQDLA